MIVRRELRGAREIRESLHQAPGLALGGAAQNELFQAVGRRPRLPAADEIFQDPEEHAQIVVRLECAMKIFQWFGRTAPWISSHTSKGLVALYPCHRAWSCSAQASPLRTCTC